MNLLDTKTGDPRVRFHRPPGATLVRLGVALLLPLLTNPDVEDTLTGTVE